MIELKSLLDEKNVFAVVGASDNPDKYGFKIYKMLKDAGYRVYPVNTRRKEVQGDQAYQTVADIPQPVDVVNIVTPPLYSLQIVQQSHQLKIPHIWLQPGAEDEQVLNWAEDNGVELIHNQCVLIQEQQKKKL